VDTIKRRIPTFLITLILVLSISLMIPGVLAAQEDEEEEEIVEIKPEELYFEITLPKIQAEEGETFMFDLDAIYKMGDEPFGLDPEEDDQKTFDITLEYPDGWYAIGMSGNTDISAINLTSGKQQGLKIAAVPLVSWEPGEYSITMTLKSAVEGDPLEASIDVTAVVAATYELDLDTKSGMLSTDMTSGKDNHVKLVVNNNSSTSLENIKITSTEPEGWRVDFDIDEIESIEAGESTEIDMTVSPAEKAIAGDYMLTLKATSDKAADDIELRVTVETPTIWGIVGIGIIVVVIIAVAIIFTRLGRR
jgi:uncharacterized membrane protein